jgi:hypothetical protein
MLIMKRLGSDANVLSGSGPILASCAAMPLAGQGALDGSGQRRRCRRSIDTKPDIEMKPEVENRHQMAGWSLSKATPEAASRRVTAARFDPAPLRQAYGILSGQLTAEWSRFLISG